MDISMSSAKNINVLKSNVGHAYAVVFMLHAYFCLAYCV